MNPPPQAFAYTVFDRPLGKPGGAILPTLEQHLAAPQLSLASIGIAPDAIAPARSPDWVSKYLVAHWPDLQGPTGECVHCAAVHCVLATALNVQGVVLPHPSVGFSYYTTTGDRTFSQGSDFLSAMTIWAIGGCCLDALYSQGWVLGHWNNKAPYPTSDLPQAECYVDAPFHKVKRYASIAFMDPDINAIKLLLNSGYPVSFQIGNHMMTLDMYDEAWFYGFDSEMVVDQTGRGVGVRAFGQEMVRTNGLSFSTVLEVDVSNVSPSGNAMTIAQIQADAAALKVGEVTQAVKDNLLGHCNTLVVDAGGSPVPPTGASPDGFRVPRDGPQITDKDGSKWTIVNNRAFVNGAFVGGYPLDIDKIGIAAGVPKFGNMFNNWYLAPNPSGAWIPTNAPL